MIPVIMEAGSVEARLALYRPKNMPYHTTASSTFISNFLSTQQIYCLPSADGLVRKMAAVGASF